MAMLGKRRSVTAKKTASQRHSGPDTPPANGRAGVEVTRLAHDGRGVARNAEGKTLFIDRALPGERVDIAVHRNRKRYEEAHVREWLVTSRERVEPVCPHYERCGGCDLQHLSLSAQRRHKRSVLVDQLARQGLSLPGEPIVLAGEGVGYRRRARLGGKVDSQGRVHLGFRERNSRHLIDIDSCPVLLPALETLLPSLRECLERLRSPRLVGHVELVAGSEQAVVVIRQLRDDTLDWQRWQTWASAHDVALARLIGRDAPRLEWFGTAPDLGYTLKSGDRHLRLSFLPGDFLQVNAEINQQMVSLALDWSQPAVTDRVLDLFAGVGNFTLALAPHVAEVIGIEGSPDMVTRLQDNARGNGLHNVEARQADLGQAPALEPLPDLVVLDPPRDGAEAVCRGLARSKVSRILYVSCDPATLARDAAHLVHAGYRITRAAVADMFVQTAHLESMLLFERG
ncbi:23S rRNA (uracil(1939)-C(5))-methyltransferase RlmD [Halomonas sp. McH1-25]|uniref:23S rRNA (uracil(1939)-C(5))-methyltransferase RlmD n=1 Tax=unclassified Halomonas TaxID=2609666 RepID=UPI001EF664A7|nr:MULTISPECIES: 23S rRNA (uracil(1939)-C(5))-methyltransferase RlmD [unclassified Halomonas]MCG7598187.1 23S rRNA (uracil(1939)-C(5))-methyltransferase RlmD [Halomonas sp. McH1-25]MCP1341030.1 23S rRNA (uracil(1939)-C(5))-methyltransferase RlmD [Halomonas sp. FL8]